MTKEFRVDELLIMKSIAETINRSSELEPLLTSVLEKLIELTELQAGWIFLSDHAPHYTMVASYHTPPAITCTPGVSRTDDSCWCLDRFWDGRLQSSVNTIYCKRLDQAKQNAAPDTHGITHHATIPLCAGSKQFGVLNVASPGKKHFSEEELTLLQSIALQIGTAIERIQLYQSQQKRANLFYRLGEVTRELGKLLEIEQIPTVVSRWIGEQLGCENTALFIEENGKLSRRAIYTGGTMTRRHKSFTFKQAAQIGEAYQENKTKVWMSDPNTDGQGKFGFKDARSSIAVPLMLRGRAFGVIYAGYNKCQPFDDVDVAVIQALADHIALAYENARLYHQQVDLLKWEERNRLARDLHDSVSQMLFSLHFTARGMEAMLQDPPEMVKHAVKDMQTLTQDALTEMRSLILQLRPVGLEQGLLTGLYRYGKAQGLIILNCVEGVIELPSRVEEALFRIGQEALNNVRKYAKTAQVQINLKRQHHQVCMEITDLGRGFSISKAEDKGTLGMRTMRERAEALGGTFQIQSRLDQGTTIRVMIPI